MESHLFAGCRYQFRRQDEGTLQGQFVDYPADVEPVEQGRQADRDSEPVPVVIKGEMVLKEPPQLSIYRSMMTKNVLHRPSSIASTNL